MHSKFVIDTSIFVNPQTREKFGSNPTRAVKAFIKILESIDASVYMPPSVFNELRNFVDGKTMEEFELVVKKRAPNTYSIYLPAAVFYDFVDDIRSRINKGMRLAEDFAKDNSPDNDKKLGKLREKYRDAMRSGIIDSKEDLELILLAKELDAPVVSSDEGVIKFSHQVGCESISGSKFPPMLQKMIERANLQKPKMKKSKKKKRNYTTPKK